jgi:hypothetical protein
MISLALGLALLSTINRTPAGSLIDSTRTSQPVLREHPDGCESFRRDNARALIVGTRRPNKLFSMTGALSLEGWQVGIAYGREQGIDPVLHDGLDAWSVGAPRQLHYVQRSVNGSLGARHVLDALLEYEPAWVVCEYQTSIELLVETVRRYGTSPAPAERSAVRRLRCSLPAEEHHGVAASKQGLLDVATAAGVRVPSSVSVPAEGLDGLDDAARLRVLAQPLPVVLKTDVDGGGSGTRICKSSRCRDRALAKFARLRTAAVVQQYIDGPTVIYEGIGLDGILLGGYARAEVVTLGRRGPPLLTRTLNEPQLEAASAALCRALRCTGPLSVGFVVDARSGEAFVIDPHLRQSGTTHPDGGTLGMGRGLYGRLLDAMVGGLPPSRWPKPTPLAHSITYGRYVLPDAKAWTAGTIELLYCDDVFMPIPWHMGAEWVDRATRAAKVRYHADGDACSWATSRFPGVRVPQLCAPDTSLRCSRPDACAQLPTVTPAHTLVDMLRPNGLCDPLTNWSRAHVLCARRRADLTGAEASAASMSERELRAYWTEHHLCRGVFVNRDGYHF